MEKKSSKNPNTNPQNTSNYFRNKILVELDQNRVSEKLSWTAKMVALTPKKEKQLCFQYGTAKAGKPAK
jgi:hypothetical protein